MLDVATEKYIPSEDFKGEILLSTSYLWDLLVSSLKLK